MIAEFHVDMSPATLGLALFVVGYGVGSLLSARLGEIAAVGCGNWLCVHVFLVLHFIYTDGRREELRGITGAKIHHQLCEFVAIR